MGFMRDTFPLAIYGMQDVFSGRILFIKVWTSNSDPKLIGRWYYERLVSTKSKRLFRFISTVSSLHGHTVNHLEPWRITQ